MELSTTEQNMQAAGVAVDEPAYEDYYGFDERYKWYLPDGKQFIEFKVMNEGDRRRYQSKTTKDIRLMRQSGDASIKVDPGEERRILFECTVTGWHVVRKQTDGSFKDVPFGQNATEGSEFGKWALQVNPTLLDGLEKEIRKHNKWMLNEQTVQAIKDQIAELEEMLEDAKKREEGKDVSA